MTPAQLQARLDSSPVSCNSFIAVSRATGKPVGEFYSLAIVGNINTEKYEVLTAYEWLVRFNHEVKEGKHRG